jgi:hypothetical protein
MGKKKEAKGKVKLPKRVAGIKIPKELRQGGEAVLTQMREHVGAELLVAGTALATAALRPAKSPAPEPATQSTPSVDAEAFGRAAGLVATVAAGALTALARRAPEKK